MKSLWSVSALALALGAGLIGCNSKPPPPQSLPTPPAIRTFLADNPRLVAGETTHLRFEIDNASSAELVDQNGKAVPFEGDASEGDATIAPDRTTFYLLRAKGDGGVDTAFVQVAVGEKLKDVFLVAVPSEAEPGQQVELLWSAFHAQQLKLQSTEGDRIALDPEAGSGVIDVRPTRTTTYELVAAPLNPELATIASTQVQVQPKLDEVQVTPPAGQVGDKLTLSWKTRGGADITVSEATFGPIAHFAAPDDATSVDSATVTWTVPEKTPAGEDVKEGRPLHFTFSLHQSAPEATLTKTVDSFVGNPPKILGFQIPTAVTQGKDFEVSWRTQNASRLQLFANGGLIYEPTALDQKKVTAGALTFASPTEDTTFELVAWGVQDTKVSRTVQVRSVKPPMVSMFNIGTPVQKPGAPTTVRFQVQDAAYLIVRAKYGPDAFYTANPQVMAEGRFTFYPGATGTYVMEAYNLAGDVVTRESFVTVSNPDAWKVSPTPMLVGNPVTVSWAMDPLTTAQVIGDPQEPPVKNNPAFDWYELEGHIDARPLVFTDANDSVTQVPLQIPFRFPFLGSTNEHFFVSTNGFVTFADPGGALPDNKPMNATADPVPTMIAPFWDDLKLTANSKVLYLVEGESFPRRLIIQWDHVQTADDPQSDLTFQLQLWETGEFHFVYKSLQGQEAYGQKANFGWRVNDSMAYELSTGGAVVGSGDEMLWFASGQLSSSYQVRADSGGVFAMYVRLANGQHIIYPTFVNALVPGAVTFNELMPAPDTAATRGQWIELYNTTSAPIDLSYLQLTSDATQTSYEFPLGTLIGPHQFLVAGESTDPLENGGATVNEEWTDFNIASQADDTVKLMAGDGEVSRFEYTTGVLLPGYSLQAPERAIDASGNPITCDRTITFGGNGAIGTPGARNESCFEYDLDRIDEDWEEIWTTGTPLFDVSTSYWYGPASLDLSSAPFKYFGTDYSTLWVNGNRGYVSFEKITDMYLQKTTPSTDNPSGTVAPFWYYLYNYGSLGEGGVYAQRFEAGVDPGVTRNHWVIEWHKMADHSWPTTAIEDLNFEIKLFDDGVIEFHYDVMDPGAQYAISQGEEATIWIERPAGDAALPIGIKTASVQPHTAFRFTPKPPTPPTP